MKHMEAENVLEKKKKSFSFGYIVTNHENVAERMADACNCTEGKLKHIGSIMKVKKQNASLEINHT